MIGLPFNDHSCLGAISQIMAAMVADHDPALVELATKYPTTDLLVDYIRSLPQRDDVGDPADGPRVKACVPSQRVRVPAEDPNCVERAALFIGVEEFHDPGHARQLATINTKIGMHTFPVVDGRPVVLDPRVTQECLECGLAMHEPGTVALSARNALEWTMDLATQDPAMGLVRNGPSAVHHGRIALRRLLDEDEIPHPGEFDAIGILFAVAERAARRYGVRWV